MSYAFTEKWQLIFFKVILVLLPTAMAKRSRARVCGVRLLWLRVRIPLWAWMSVSCECCVLSHRGLCDGVIARPEESYWLWRAIVFYLETWKMRRPRPELGCCPTERNGPVVHPRIECDVMLVGINWRWVLLIRLVSYISYREHFSVFFSLSVM